ncbi:xylose ABC transporter ATP-binding protein [Desmospora profundinema]|uniref:D-xylose transport system ATP-binding protein n=1 Tax=Desmospora profundinema TaxID=1571184 RepID=A0ABU1IQ02_9BACL|nr:xylose ABC transporter ATP-binding protein [Desmospora profundinema]MDR6226865.1 D-xylose transport system ATP-binding protein [Desmospora profundinema]
MDYALEMKDVSKTFPGVKALDNVNFAVKKGEIHALCGENGAGKSTLIKILSGLYPAGTFEGEIRINGKPVSFSDIRDAERTGIAIIHQELALVKEMTVGENIFLGAEPSIGPVVHWDHIYREANRLLQEVGLKEIGAEEIVGHLGIGQQQLVEIAKALSKQADILLLDEPTAALTDTEVQVLIGILRQLRERGVTCIYISHKLDEVFAIADSITVLRDGRSVGTHPVQEWTEERVIAHMVGRELTDRYPEPDRTPGDVVFSVHDYTVWHPQDGSEKIHGVSLQVRRGEIVGVAGLMGAGRTELMASLFGAYPGKSAGEIRMNGQKIRIRSTADAIRHGLAFVTEDRKRTGLVLGMDVKTNTSLAHLDRLHQFGVLRENEEVRLAEQYSRELRVKTPSMETAVGTLSGGNQQKVVLAKWLMTRPQLLILDEPTRGIDVGAKFEIYQIMNRLAREGVSILMVSSELPEVLGMSDRIYVMCEGRITAEWTREEATQEKIMHAATGGR